MQEQGLSGPRGGTSLPSTWLEAGQGMGAADEWEALCLLGPQKGDAAGNSRTPTFTAGFLQRHQILGHSSRAQPASLVVSPVPGGERRAAYSGRGLKPAVTLG